MPNVNFKTEIQFFTYTCSCGGLYAITEEFRAACQQSGRGWHCPYCRGLTSYSGTTEADRLRADLKAERDRKEKALARENEERQRADKAERALKLHKTKAKNGTCPCRKRTFSQLQRHMANKHPDYAP